MYLGIDNQTGLIFEGAGGPDTPSIPTPAGMRPAIPS